MSLIWIIGLTEQDKHDVKPTLGAMLLAYLYVQVCVRSTPLPRRQVPVGAPASPCTQDFVAQRALMWGWRKMRRILMICRLPSHDFSVQGLCSAVCPTRITYPVSESLSAAAPPAHSTSAAPVPAQPVTRALKHKVTAPAQVSIMCTTLCLEQNIYSAKNKAFGNICTITDLQTWHP